MLNPRDRLPAALILLIGIALSSALLLTLRGWEEEKILAEFNQSARDHIRNLRDELQDSVDALEQVKGFFEASEFNVTRNEFHAFAQPMLKRHRFIRNLGWGPLAPDSQRTNYEASARPAVPGFQFTERDAQGQTVRAGSRAEYVPAYFIEPADQTMLGFDFLSQPVYREALTKAHSLARTVATGRLPFEHARFEKSGEYSFALVTPVMGKALPGEKQAPLPGYAISIIHAGALMEKAVANLHPKETNIQLIDATVAGSEQVLHYHNAASASTAPLPFINAIPDYLAAAATSETFEFAGRKWIITCTAAPGYRVDAATLLPWAAALGILLLSILVALIQLATSSERRSTELAEVNRQLSLEISERRRVENALRASEQQVRMIADNAPALIAYYDAEEYCRFANNYYAEFYGLNPAQIAGTHLREILGAKAYQETKPQIEKVLAGNAVHYEQVHLTGDGTTHYLDVSLIPNFNEQREVLGAYVLVHDVTERKLMEIELFDQKERAQVTLESIGDAVITCGANSAVSYLNQVAERLTGWSSNEAQGQPLPAVFSITHELTGEPMADPVQQCLTQGTTVSLSDHTVLTRRDGAQFAIGDSTSPIRDRNGNIIGAVLVFHDVTQQRAMARQLTHQSTHDALTALVNRSEFERRLSRLLSSCREDHTQHAMCYLDLDGFKLVNDSCGHQAGDVLLSQIGGVLQQRLRSRDTLARLGGDEFGVLLERCSLEQSLRIAEELLEAVNDFHFVWEGKPFTVGVSIGVVTITENSPSMTEVMNAADAACYAAKQQGRNRVLLYQSKDDEQNKQDDHVQWLADLSKTLEQQRFHLLCQAIVPLSPGIPGVPVRPHYEILLRLEGKNGSLITPGAFLPFADRNNLTPGIDRWVVQRVISLCHAKRQKNPQWPLPLLNVNISGASLNDPAFADFVRGQLLANDLPGNTLCFEISEATAYTQLTTATHFIRELKQLGCAFAIDGFGGSAASFAQIKNLPVDFIKISGNFVRDMYKDPVDKAIVEAANRIAGLLGIRSIGLCVENVAILEQLQALNIGFGQGFSISNPVPLEEVFGKG